MKFALSSYLGCLLVCGTALAADIKPEMERIRQEFKLPALGSVVFNAEGVLALETVGVRKMGDETPATSKDKWHLGSITKSMTASLAAMLVNDGKIKWTTTLGEQFPGIHSDYSTVSLQELLAHRGGLSHDGPEDVWKNFSKRSGSPQETRQWWVNQILHLPPQHTPGKYEYSNPGIATAGVQLETATGKAWEALMQERLFAPLGLKDAGFGVTATKGTVDQPWGHTDKGTPIPPGPKADNPPGLGPAGTVHMSLTDLATYGRWHLTEGASKPELLPSAKVKHLHTPAHPAENGAAYEFGWMMLERSWAGGTAISHSGSNNMNFAIIWLAPKKKFGFAVTVNQGGDNASKGSDKLAGVIVQRMGEFGK